MLKLTTDKHEASRGLSATAELLVPSHVLAFRVLDHVSQWHTQAWCTASVCISSQEMTQHASVTTSISIATCDADDETPLSV